MSFVEKHFDMLILLTLLLLLIAAHAFMLHWNRPIEIVRWCEGLINQVFVAIIGYTAGKQVGKINGQS